MGSYENDAYKEHVREKYLWDMHKEAERAKKAARGKKPSLPDLARDKTGKWILPGAGTHMHATPPTPPLPAPRLDWMTLEFELTARHVIALDEETEQEMVYRRLQASADVECRWVGEGDVVTPEGHTTERLMEMWPSGFRVIKQFVHGFEPPHTCPAKPTACPYCRAIRKTK